jgi:hypothetical protein
MKNVTTTEFQAMEYLFDLGNCAKEFGFKKEESWEVSLASDEERSKIQKTYNPTISVKVLPEALTEVLSLIKNQLNLKRSEMELHLNSKEIYNNQYQYIVAFNPERKRT